MDYEELERKFWEDNQYLLSLENYPKHLIDCKGRPLFPVEGRIPLDNGTTLITYQWPYWDKNEQKSM